jgi:hypothetical protein
MSAFDQKRTLQVPSAGHECSVHATLGITLDSRWQKASSPAGDSPIVAEKECTLHGTEKTSFAAA